MIKISTEVKCKYSILVCSSDSNMASCEPLTVAGVWELADVLPLFIHLEKICRLGFRVRMITVYNQARCDQRH